MLILIGSRKKHLDIKASIPPDRVAGILMGLAAGDRNGGPIQMALRLAGSLQHQGVFDIHDVGRRYLDWWKEGAFDTGPTTARVLELVHSGMPFRDASKKVHQNKSGLTAGCNPAHRIGPLSMLRALPDRELPKAAMDEAALTHRHPLAGDVSAAVVSLCRALIRGLDWSGALAATKNGRTKETSNALEVPNIRSLKRGGFAPDTLAAAIYFVATSSNFKDALSDALHFAGPENYCPVLVGTIGGARWGASEIPKETTHHLGSLFPIVRDLGRQLAMAWEEVESYTNDE